MDEFTPYDNVSTFIRYMCTREFLVFRSLMIYNEEKLYFIWFTGVAVLGGSLYAIGGNDGSTSLDSVERWDPAFQQWFYSAPLTGARSDVGVAVLDNK